MAILTTALALFWANGRWLASLWVGLAWGLLNAWCLIRILKIAQEPRGGLRLGGWLLFKLLGLYGGLAFILLRGYVAVSGWLVGFTLSLLGLALSYFPRHVASSA